MYLVQFSLKIVIWNEMRDMLVIRGVRSEKKPPCGSTMPRTTTALQWVITAALVMAIVSAPSSFVKPIARNTNADTIGSNS